MAKAKKSNKKLFGALAVGTAAATASVLGALKLKKDKGSKKAKSSKKK